MGILNKANFFKRVPDIYFGLLLLLAFSIPLSQYVSARVLFMLIVVCFIQISKINLIRIWSMGFDVALYMIVILFGLVYSDDFSTGWKVIETSLSLLAVPVIVSMIRPFRREHFNMLFFAFTAGLCLASVICLANASLTYSRTGLTEVFFFDSLTGIIDSHPTYLAYYLIVAITFGLYLLHYERNHYPTWAIVIIISFLFLMLMLTGGMTAFVSMLFVLAFFLLKFMLDEKRDRQISILLVVVSFIACMFVFNELNRGDSSVARNDSWERLVLWESALKANPNVLFGVGTGDYRSVLNAYYVSHDLIDFANANFNAHNQFIDTYFANGLLGLSCLVLLLGRPIYLSVINGNTLGTLIFFPFIIYGVTEVFFGRYQGVVFFALMQQLFMAYYLGYKPAFSLKRA